MLDPELESNPEIKTLWELWLSWSLLTTQWYECDTSDTGSLSAYISKVLFLPICIYIYNQIRSNQPVTLKENKKHPSKGQFIQHDHINCAILCKHAWTKDPMWIGDHCSRFPTKLLPMYTFRSGTARHLYIIWVWHVLVSIFNTSSTFSSIRYFGVDHIAIYCQYAEKSRVSFMFQLDPEIQSTPSISIFRTRSPARPQVRPTSSGSTFARVALSFQLPQRETLSCIMMQHVLLSRRKHDK